MKKYLLCSLLLVFCSSTSFAQFKESEKAAKKWFKKAKSASSDEAKVEYYSIAIDYEPSQNLLKILLNNRGVSYLKQGHFQEALDDFTKVVQIEKKDYLAFYNLARAQIGLNRLEDAKESLMKSIKIKSRFAFSQHKLALILSELKDNKGALKYLNKAIRINPKEPQFYEDRARLKKRMGDDSGALKDLQKAKKLREKQ